MILNCSVLILPTSVCARQFTEMMIEYFYRAVSSSNIHGFTGMFERNGMEVALVRNMAIWLDFGLFPYSKLIRFCGEHEQVVFLFLEEGGSCSSL